MLYIKKNHLNPHVSVLNQHFPTGYHHLSNLEDDPYGMVRFTGCFLSLPL